MTSFSRSAAERGLDTMVLVYSLLHGHPASITCEQFIRSRTGWFLPPLILFEARAILTKVYGVPAADATRKLTQFASGPVLVTAVDEPLALVAPQTADRLGIDLTDAVLLETALARGAGALATDDSRLIQACQQANLNAENPVDASLRQQIAAWETAHLPLKGLPRILRRVHQWLSSLHPQAGQDF